MCGITGALDPDGTIGRATVEQLNLAQHHRGPDNAVVVDEGMFVLGNTRLAIQDPTPEGNQPFRDPDGRYVVVFNGEIYNFHELVHRHQLEVTTGCDGEIIPLLWERFGADCLSMFRGMYAIALADTVERRLYLARDPFGVKPLRWRKFRGGVVFASEARPLWSLDRSLPISGDALSQYLLWGAVPASPFDGIETVEPGQCIAFGQGAEPVVAHRSEAIPLHAGPPPPLSGGAPLAAALRESVRLHLIADVPTALLLSAGVDSTLMALAARELGERLHCLTVTGPVGEDESLQARATALEYGHSHETVPAVLGEGTVDDFFRSMQQPTVDGLNTYLVSRAVHAAGYKVALSGLGGDEALGGYPYVSLLRALPALSALDRVPDGTTRRFLDSVAARRGFSPSSKPRRLLSPGGPRTPAGVVELQRELYRPEIVARLLDREPVVPSTDSRERGYRAMARAEFRRYLGPMLLTDADAFSMASSIELRVPFVDVPFFAHALARHRLRGKPELVSQMGDRYLGLLRRRRKTGFSVPMLAWLGGGVLQGVIADARRADAPIWDHLDRKAGLVVLDADTDRWSEPWSLAALDAWLRRL